jgi:hypothetical protein
MVPGSKEERKVTQKLGPLGSQRLESNVSKNSLPVEEN